MAFLSARILSPARDGINGYCNINDPDGAPRAIQLTGEILDSVLGSRITQVWIEGDDFAALPASDPGLADTPADPRYQAIMTFAIGKIKTLHAAWVAEQADALKIVPKDPALVAALPTITPNMLP